VNVTNAHPAGSYLVQVKAFNPSLTSTTTFTLTVLHGTACSTYAGFTSTAAVATGNQPESVAIGDFNNDGKQDFVAANFANNNVSVRLGNGSGGFSSPSTPEVSVGAQTIAIAVGDFNNDGKLDFATANFGSRNVSIRLGDGLGGFSSPATAEVTIGIHPFSIAMGDFNNDGKLDFVSTNPEGSASTNPDGRNVSIRLGDGAGGFSSPSVPEVIAGADYVVTGDFNNDGNLDFASLAPAITMSQFD
jgi:hypothetical protein